MKVGDRVKLILKDKEEREGIVMPSSDRLNVVLKLDSGYNMGINRTKIQKIVPLLKPKAKMFAAEKVVHNPDFKTITILHTGGTIASRVSYETGGVGASFTPEDILAMFPELKTIANINSRLIRNMWSEDLMFSHYNLLAKEIEKEVKKGVDGIIITHGTDTMHYTAAALGFILEELSIPVVLVGAQRSSDRGSSDAGMNLIAACHFITKTKYNEVAICMHSDTNDEICNILPAMNVRKFHTSRRDAFQVVNSNVIATVSNKGKVNFVSSFVPKKKANLKLRLFKEVKVGILKIHPNMFIEELKAFSRFNGLIIEGTGLGHAPINVIDDYTKNHKQIFNEIKKLASLMPVVMTSQCVFGRINMNVYETGRMLQEIGVLGNLLDMTTETAFIKLAWLLSNYKKVDAIKMISTNLRGELSERTTFDEKILEK